MKRKQIILFSVLLLITALIYVALKSNQKEVEKEMKSENLVRYVPVRKVRNTEREMQSSSYGQVNPNTEIIVSFEVQGKLQQGDLRMKPGVKFNKGQILYRVDNEEAFYTLSARKTALANLLLGAMPDLELDFPGEVKKWNAFLNNLEPSKLLPELPAVRNERERMFLTARTFLAEYYNVKSMEARMDKYLYIAPFSGTVIQVYSEPGAIANPGAQIAKIAQVGEYEVKVPVDLDDLSAYRSENSASFINSNGKVVGNGKIIRISDVVNQQTQSADVYYSIKSNADTPLYHGMFVNVSIAQNAKKRCMPVPRNAVRNNQVLLLEGEKLNEQAVLVVGSKPDTLFITGLEDGKVVVMEYITDQRKEFNYKGINK